MGDEDCCSIIESGIRKFDISKIYIATADVNNDIITNFSEKITFKNRPSRANMQPMANSVWFAKMIDSRKLILVDNDSNFLINKTIFSTGFAGLQCNEDNLYYIWSFLLSDKFNTIKNNYCHGTTMQAVNNNDISNIKIIIPDSSTLKKYKDIVKPIFDKIRDNMIEIQKLTQLRDTLLPKLMSGEIDVSEVQV